MSLIQKFLAYKNDYHTAFVTYDEFHRILKVYSWKEYVQYAENFARCILANAQKNVAIHACNCPEWLIAAMGAIVAGKYFCGIYNTNKDDQCIHILQQGDCDVLIVDNVPMLLKYY